jgi:hypothetical protein
MRCRNCLTVCDDTDTVCSFCRRPISRSKVKSSTPSMSIYSIVFMAIGLAIYNFLAPRWFPSSGRGFNYEQMMWAGVVGGACALFGAFVGMLLGSSNADR